MLQWLIVFMKSIEYTAYIVYCILYTRGAQHAALGLDAAHLISLCGPFKRSIQYTAYWTQIVYSMLYSIVDTDSSLYTALKTGD